MLLNKKSVILTIAIISFVAWLFIAILVNYSIPSFIITFKTLDIIPLMSTKIIFVTYQYWFLFSLVPLYITIKTFSDNSINISYFNVSGCVALGSLVFVIVLFLFTLDSIYSPILSLQTKA
jgi:hypothetical protein